MTHLLDSDTCIGVLRQRPDMVQRLSQIAPTDCAVSMVTVYELFCGVERARDPARERRKVERFVSAIIELPLDRAAAEAAARIRADLEPLFTTPVWPVPRRPRNAPGWHQGPESHDG